MTQKNNHIDLTAVDRQSKAFFSGGTFVWERSDAEIWANIGTLIDNRPKSRVIHLNFTLAKWVAAAVIVLFMGLGSFMRLYTAGVEAPAGQHLEAMLPDGSQVNLNAESSISYHPYWWKINRKVKLEGEAFFQVQKGKKFTVASAKGTTQVLGTSFNIFAREDIYKVTCLTGMVKITSKQGFEAVIKPNSKAEIGPTGQINIQTNIETFPEISWKKNIFIFTATPVDQVFKEIERQYDVNIQAQAEAGIRYTGNFSKDRNVEDILNYVCPALGLKYVRKANGSYFIIPENE